MTTPHRGMRRPPGFRSRSGRVYYTPAAYDEGPCPGDELTTFGTLTEAHEWRDDILDTIHGGPGWQRDLDDDDKDEHAWEGDIDQHLDGATGGGATGGGAASHAACACTKRRGWVGVCAWSGEAGGGG